MPFMAVYEKEVGDRRVVPALRALLEDIGAEAKNLRLEYDVHVEGTYGIIRVYPLNDARSVSDIGDRISDELREKIDFREVPYDIM